MTDPEAPYLVLIVDDMPENIQILITFLEHESLEIAIAQSGLDALAIVAQEAPDLILLDIMMPVMDGFEVCRRLKSNPTTHEIPIIFLTAKTESADIVRGFECGAVDYITKPFNMKELTARVFTHLELKRARDRNEIQKRKLAEANRELQRLSILQEQTFSSALKESEERFRNTFEQAAVGIVHIALDGRFLLVNQRFCDIVSYTQEQLLQLNVQDIIHPEDFESGMVYVGQMLRGELQIYTMEKRYIRQDGRLVWVNVTVSLVQEVSGPPKYFLGVFEDISQRKRAEEALRNSEQQYRLLAESVADGIGIIRSGKWAFVNEALARMLGEKAESLPGSTAEEFLLDDYQEELHRMSQELEQKALGAHSWPVLKYVARENESGIWMEGRQSLIRWQGELAILIDMRDITQQKIRQIEIEEERERLQRENLQLRSTMKDRYQFGRLVGKSLAMQEVYELILKAAATDKDVLIFGESGTGKELIARTIHELSNRERHTFVPVNCGAVPEALFEREFFGHRRGAFTGADRDKPGFFGSAHQGTLFLDEVGELSPIQQVKLLRAIESGEYTPIGDNRPKTSDVRIVAATHRNLREMVRQELMREDFFYRIHVIVIDVPPLRARKEDIPLLIEHFLKQYSEQAAPAQLPGRVLEAFYEYDWPGNIRQLQNTLSRYLTLGYLDFVSPLQDEDPVKLEETSFFSSPAVSPLHKAVETLERELILRALEQEHWHRKHAAQALGIPRKTLFRKMKKYDLL